MGRLRCPFGPGTVDSGRSAPDHLGGTQITLGRPTGHKTKWHSDERMRVGETQRDGLSFQLGKSDQLWSGMDYWVTLVSGDKAVADSSCATTRPSRSGWASPAFRSGAGTSPSARRGRPEDRDAVRGPRGHPLHQGADPVVPRGPQRAGADPALGAAHPPGHRAARALQPVDHPEHRPRLVDPPSSRWCRPRSPRPPCSAPRPTTAGPCACTWTAAWPPRRRTTSAACPLRQTRPAGVALEEPGAPRERHRGRPAPAQRHPAGRHGVGPHPLRERGRRAARGSPGGGRLDPPAGGLRGVRPVAARGGGRLAVKLSGGSVPLEASARGRHLRRRRLPGGRRAPRARLRTLRRPFRPAGTTPCSCAAPRGRRGSPRWTGPLRPPRGRRAPPPRRWLRRRTGATRPATPAPGSASCRATATSCWPRADASRGTRGMRGGHRAGRPDPDQAQAPGEGHRCDPQGHFPVELVVDASEPCGHHGPACLYLERHGGVPYVPSVADAPPCKGAQGTTYCRSLMPEADARALLHWWDAQGADVTGRAPDLRSGTLQLKGAARALAFVLRRPPAATSSLLLRLGGGAASPAGPRSPSRPRWSLAARRWRATRAPRTARRRPLPRWRGSPPMPRRLCTTPPSRPATWPGWSARDRRGLPAERDSLGGWAPAADSLLLAPQRLRVKLRGEGRR